MFMAPLIAPAIVLAWLLPYWIASAPKEAKATAAATSRVEG